MHTLHARMRTAWNAIPAYLQTGLLLGATAYFLLQLGKSLGQALYYLTH